MVRKPTLFLDQLSNERKILFNTLGDTEVRTIVKFDFDKAFNYILFLHIKGIKNRTLNIKSLIGYNTCLINLGILTLFQVTPVANLFYVGGGG